MFVLLRLLRAGSVYNNIEKQGNDIYARWEVRIIKYTKETIRAT